MLKALNETPVFPTDNGLHPDNGPALLVSTICWERLCLVSESGLANGLTSLQTFSLILWQHLNPCHRPVSKSGSVVSWGWESGV